MKSTPQEIVDWIYAILEVLDHVLCKLQLGYSAMDGTLLGAVRHRGLIPWDDDADLFMHETDAAILIRERAELKQYGLDMMPWWYGYKIYPAHVPLVANAAGVQVPYPSVDIVTVGASAARLVPTSAKARELWPNEYLTQAEWQGRTRQAFGDLQLVMPHPESAAAILDRLYGPDWRTVAFQIWDHVTDQPMKTSRVPLPSAAPALRQHRLIAIAACQDQHKDQLL